VRKLHSAAEILRALRRAGFVQISQRGSHIKLKKREGERERAEGTLASILEMAGLSHEQFDELL
jgi:predicted RNA binding protein YcfA (HicA-like mRNA interferase family)